MRPFLMCCSCGLEVGCSTISLVSTCSLWRVACCRVWQGPDSQIITATDNPVLARNEAASTHGHVCQLERLDSGLCLVAPDVDMAAVEGGEDPWLFTPTCQLCLGRPYGQVCRACLRAESLSARQRMDLPRSGGSRCPLLVRSGHFAVVSCQFLVKKEGYSGRRGGRIARGTYKSCLCALRGILLALIFTADGLGGLATRRLLKGKRSVVMARPASVLWCQAVRPSALFLPCSNRRNRGPYLHIQLHLGGLK